MRILGTKRAAACFTAAALFAAFANPQAAVADEGGVSFWVPGFLSTLAAAPQKPGWSVATVYYHTSVDAGDGAAFPRGGRIDAGIDADGDLFMIAPSYTFEDPLWGAQAGLSLLLAYGHMDASVDATLTGPAGGVLTGHRGDDRTDMGDAAPMFSLRWNHGVNNYLAYVTAGVPVGAYNSNRIANLGIGHWAIDTGGGYTYFNPATKIEFSVVSGLTYNFENPDTNYQNGVDLHVDASLSKFVTERLQIGLTGYTYQQLTGDSGDGAVLGDFESRIWGVGPQIGYMLPIGDRTVYVNVKGYKEFSADHRPEGWNMWLALSIPLSE